jgi:spore germination cell wall hydrolase CwlJ-like protein
MKQVLLLLFIFMFIGATNVGSNSFQKVSWKDLRPELPAPIISTNEITLIDVEDKITSKVFRFGHHTEINVEESRCLALNIFFEAAVESTAGKLAVAHVTLNRVKSNNYPNSICEVVKEGIHYSNGLPKRNRCQFSWYCDGKGDIPKEGRLWNESLDLANYVVERQDDLRDITDGATHYHATYIDAPRWTARKKVTTSIDQHIFYRRNWRL